jgi:cytochrome c553
MKRSLAILSFLSVAPLTGAKLPDVVDFNDHIQPIISENCYQCHGPDSSTRAPKKNPLRLDRAEFAFLDRPNGTPSIIKGDAQASEVFQRIISKDVDEVMPPPKSHKKPLKPGEIALIKKWIQQGSKYEEHWSFTPLVRPEPPKRDWGQNAIDKFIVARHREHDLDPGPPEEPSRLLRRLTFDLTGLPPTPEEVATFREMAAQDLPAAIEMTAAKLLTTDDYAEHFARHWLDTARYGDTHGIHNDNYRGIWPYRDWVIEAFLQNMPFDQFTREQIAGDLLPNATLDQKIATGFNRCIPTTGEGGAIDQEYQAIYATDQVSTTSAVFLGLSTGCAACHDHKFDPISQKDFYSLTAFFRNSTMKAMDRNAADHAPVVFAPRLEDRQRFTTVDHDILMAGEAIQKRRSDAQAVSEAWLAEQKVETSTEATLALIADTSLPLTVRDGKITGQDGQISKSWDFSGKTQLTEGLGEVANLANLNIDLGDFGLFQARDQITFSGYLYLDGKVNGPLISRMDSEAEDRGWDLWLEDGKLGAHIVDTWPDQAIKGVTTEPLKQKQWHYFALIYDGKAPPKKSLTVFIDGTSFPIEYSQAGKVENLETNVPTRLGARHPNISFTGNANLHTLKIFRRKLSNDEITKAAASTTLNRLLAVPAEQRDQSQKEALFDFYLTNLDGPSKGLVAKKDQLIAEKETLRKRGSTTLVMEEKPSEAFAHILERGEYSLEGEKVPAAIPKVFKHEPKHPTLTRKDLADWLVSEENPLTARVTVNRLWYYFFGRGIVETTEDFGIMGSRPTHPELLDYLAVELMENGWDLQHIMKLITSSATYQQSAKTTSANRKKDAENLYLWRAARFRLEAEQIRDMALSASGLLVKKIGGPSVKPYQPEGVWEAVAMKGSNTRLFKQDKGEGLYRRSLYTFWKRTAAPPSMEILNAPTREIFCVRRDRTNTPLAAFVTMNDTQFIEASRALATRAIKQSQSFSQRLDFITIALMSRTLDNEEQDVVKKALDHHLKYYLGKPEFADQLLKVGESPLDSTIANNELAAWTLIASQIFNLDETLTK